MTYTTIKLREGLTFFTDEGGLFGQNMSAGKPVMFRVNGNLTPVTAAGPSQDGRTFVITAGEHGTMTIRELREALTAVTGPGAAPLAGIPVQLRIAGQAQPLVKVAASSYEGMFAVALYITDEPG